MVPMRSERAHPVFADDVCAVAGGGPHLGNCRSSWGRSRDRERRVAALCCSVIKPVELVVFDCDGVLVDSERIAVHVQVALGAELGWPLTEDEVVARFIGRSHAAIPSQRMGVAPAACDVGEDSRPGVQAARAAGMRALGYAGGLTPVRAM